MTSFSKEDSDQFAAAMRSTRLVYEDKEPKRTWFESVYFVEALGLIAVCYVVVILLGKPDAPQAQSLPSASPVVSNMKADK